MGRVWIIKNIFKVHPFYYIAAFISALTGHFKGFILFTFIIVFHEVGHILTGIRYKWKIEEVLILPFGALTIFNEDLNRPIKEEFFITIMGPIFQILLTLLFKDNPHLVKYSLIILIFNLLPIYPLDGSKLCNLFLNKITSFNRSHILMLLISVISIVVLLLKDFNLILLLIVSFLILKVLNEIKDHNSLFNRFLLERYLKHYNFKKMKQINSIYDMKRDYRHVFKSEKTFITERNLLKKRFDFKYKTW